MCVYPTLLCAYSTCDDVVSVVSSLHMSDLLLHFLVFSSTSKGLHSDGYTIFVEFLLFMFVVQVCMFESIKYIILRN